MNNLCKNILFGNAGSFQSGCDGSITPDFANTTIIVDGLHETREVQLFQNHKSDYATQA